MAQYKSREWRTIGKTYVYSSVLSDLSNVPKLSMETGESLSAIVS